MIGGSKARFKTGYDTILRLLLQPINIGSYHVLGTYDHSCITSEYFNPFIDLMMDRRKIDLCYKGAKFIIAKRGN